MRFGVALRNQIEDGSRPGKTEAPSAEPCTAVDLDAAANVVEDIDLAEPAAFNSPRSC